MQLYYLKQNKLMEKTVFIGADVSKKTIDFCSIQENLETQILNEDKCLMELVKQLLAKGIQMDNVWIVFEHTGMYSEPLAEFCSREGIRYSQVPALDIKRSMGLTRGKSDKVDAMRICKYAIEKKDRLIAESPLNKSLSQMKRLLHLRDKLVSQRAGYQTTLKELREVLKLKSSAIELKVQGSLVKVLTTQITKIEKEIKAIINEDNSVKKNAELLVSIKGVGFIIAAYIIVYTQNFTRFQNSRKFSCYCGTAPFPHQSGTSIRGKTRVSHLANKRLKSLLEMGARTAIQYDPEIKQFYLNRVEKGKNKTSTLNIVRNKLIGRMFAVIKKQQPYEIKFAA